MKVFSRRIGRSEYWLYTAALVVFAILLNVFGLSRSGSALLVGWIIIWTWRLHDFGKSGWYNLVPIGAMLAVTAAATVLVFNDQEFSDAFALVMGTGNHDVTDRGVWLVVGFFLALLTTQLTYMVWLGIKHGDGGENAYGLPKALFGKRI